MKGGGCENKNIQYSLPAELEGLGKAGRDLDGIRKCILHAIYQAQGQGCSAGFIGVGIGGDRTTGYELAKQQLFRRVDDTNPIAELRQLEEYILDKANQLGIGTMGFGGEVTLLGCKIGVMNRLPASFSYRLPITAGLTGAKASCSTARAERLRNGYTSEEASFRWTAPRKVKRQELPKKRQKLLKQLL